MALIELLAPLAVLAAVTLAVLGIYAVLFGNRSLLKSRVGQYMRRPGSAVVISRTSPLFRDRSLSSFGLLNRLLSGRAWTESMARDLERAAVPMRVGEFLLLRWLVAVAFLVAGFLFGMPAPFAIGLGVLGFLVPKFYVGRKEQQRIKKIDDQLVDALTMMANALRSGSGLLQAMDLVSRELPAPIAEEFAQIVAEVGVGSTVDQALAEFGQRVPSYDLFLLITAITVQRNAGGNLAEVLDNIAHTIRERQRLLRQVQVETAEQRFSGYILLALPVGMLFLFTVVNRPYIETLFIEPVGRVILGVALTLQVVGYLVMRKIADVKV